MTKTKTKQGKILLIGRPNVGKSTFLNNLIGTKVAITSPKPQTTRFPIKALYENEKGTIIFIDTPGIFGKAEDSLSKRINQNTFQALHEEIDLVIYMVDHSRKRDFEEAKVLGIVRKIDKPKILVINKIDEPEPTYLPQYKFMEDEFKDVFLISALNQTHVKPLIQRIFELIPEKNRQEGGVLSEEQQKPCCNNCTTSWLNWIATITKLVRSPFEDSQ